jgi:GH18 family chitinase
MSYDAHGSDHSPFQLAETTIQHFKRAQIDLKKLTLGVPFYGRNARGEWKSYEDLIQKPDANFNYNSKEMLTRKIELAKRHNIGGVMVWEAGNFYLFIIFFSFPRLF